MRPHLTFSVWLEESQEQLTHLALRSCSCPLAWIPFLGAMLQAHRTLCALVCISCRGLLGIEPPWGRR